MESLAENGFDLVLLDIVMPDVDGYQVMDYIDRRSLETPVIFITGHASEGLAFGALRRGACDCLKKPLDHEELLKTVERAVDQKRRDNEQKQLSKRPIRTKEELEAAQKVIHELLARMSYTMRIPVNGVVGLAKLLLDTELSSEQRECAEMLRSTAQSLLDMINGDLDLLQAEGDKLGLDLIDFDLPATMEALYDLMAERALKKGLQLTWIVHPKVPSRLRGDPRRLRQILFNLVDNAMKFTEKGQVVIWVSLDEETDTHVTLRFTITDTGIGIPADRMNRLFNKSPSQADASTRPRHRGTGLGLVISKKLAQMMGGEMGVNSQEGKGSTFWFTAVYERQLEAKERPSILPSDTPTQLILEAELDTALKHSVGDSKTSDGTQRPEKG
jgi:signal transduction histidine kinase